MYLAPGSKTPTQPLKDCGENINYKTFFYYNATAHGAMGHQIDPSWWTHSAISRSSWCKTNGRDMVYHVRGMVQIKDPLLLISKRIQAH